MFTFAQRRGKNCKIVGNYFPFNFISYSNFCTRWIYISQSTSSNIKWVILFASRPIIYKRKIISDEWTEIWVWAFIVCNLICVGMTTVRKKVSWIGRCGVCLWSGIFKDRSWAWHGAGQKAVQSGEREAFYFSGGVLFSHTCRQQVEPLFFFNVP